MPSEDSSTAVLLAIGRLQTSVESVVAGQTKLFDLTDGFQRTTATLQSQHSDAFRRIEKLEEVQDDHSEELAEARGAQKTNRWLTIALPPLLIVIGEFIKAAVAFLKHG